MQDLFLLIGSYFIMLGIPVVIICATVAAVFLLCAAIYVVATIPFYKMAKRAGLPNAWLAWIPYGNVYIMLQLSKREFNIFDRIRTSDRTQVFWYYLIFILAIMPAINAVLGFFGAIPIINILVGILALVVNVAYMVAVYIFNWRVYYDILMTYGMKENALVFSILGCFVPFVMIVLSYMIMNNEPDYSC